MKTLLTVICVLMTIGTNALGGDLMQNVFKDTPYDDARMGKRQLIDEQHLLVMQIALKPGQQVPQHNANSNVHLLILEGQVAVTLDGKEFPAAKGDILPVAFKTLMSILNTGSENATFLVIKTPNPSEMKQ